MVLTDLLARMKDSTLWLVFMMVSYAAKYATCVTTARRNLTALVKGIAEVGQSAPVGFERGDGSSGIEREAVSRHTMKSDKGTNAMPAKTVMIILPAWVVVFAQGSERDTDRGIETVIDTVRTWLADAA
jgi:hypothetical protein